MSENLLEHLLLYPIYNAGEHPQQPDWDKFVYDTEELHYGFLSMFLKESPSFAKDLLQLPPRSSVQAVLPPYRGPQGHPFDLEIWTSSSQRYYAEIKTWARLYPNQVARQTQHLHDRGAKGVYILTPFQRWSPKDISAETNSLARLLLFNEVSSLLQSNLHELQQPSRSVAEAYITAIGRLFRRTTDAA